MIRHILIAFLTACVGLFPAKAEWSSPHPLSAEENAPAALLPFPKKVVWKEGGCPLTPKLLKSIGDGAPLSKDDPGLSVRIAPLPPVFGTEGYRLSIGEKGVRIEAATEAGVFYAFQTLRQLAHGCHGRLPACKIEDYPAFAVRGFLHDCGRNFRDIATLKNELAAAAQLKLNYFQWHLTDNPGWHIECKAYPVLNDPAKRTRDPHDTYSYDEIRELLRYAQALHITVIPELDMPGHSAYFNRCFGFAMHSEQGMKVLEELIDEFCREIPAELCPIIHIGADEVKIPNAQEFIRRMSARVKSHGREPMQWGGTHDLPVGADCIAQRWGEGRNTANKSLDTQGISVRTIDSSVGYTNLFDPALLVRRYFFMRPCGVAKGDNVRMGGIICTWPDIRVGDKKNIPLQSPHWPGICAFAERMWVGGAGDGDDLPPDLPVADTEAMRAYASFERRMDAVRRTVLRGHAFPHRPESQMQWTLIGPVPTAQAEGIRKALLAGSALPQPNRKARGASLYFRTKVSTGGLGMFPQAKPGVTVWAVGKLSAKQAGEQPYMLGFDAPARSSRRWSGVPKAGEWSQCGTRIWLNGKELRNPKHYRLAGQKRCERDTWNTPLNEQPLDNEEIWWAGKPTPLPLRKGDNTIIIEQPYIGEFQTWGINVIPWEK